MKILPNIEPRIGTKVRCNTSCKDNGVIFEIIESDGWWIKQAEKKGEIVWGLLKHSTGEDNFYITKERFKENLRNKIFIRIV